MTQKELAARMGLTEKTVTEIVKGASPITQKHAQSLENILGLPYNFWINLQRNYDDAVFALKRDEELRNQITMAEQFPQESLKKMQLLPKGSNKGTVLVERLLQIFKVQNLNQVVSLYDLEFDCKISDKLSVNEFALVTWMRLGELEAEKKFDYHEFSPFDSKKALSNIYNFKKINLETTPEIFLKKLQSECEKIGIAFVIVPEIKGSRISGMARWTKFGKRKIPMIQLSLRGKKHDMFWFTFFHELGHIILHKNEIHVDLDNDNSSNSKENEADTFSKNALIHESDYTRIIKMINADNVTEQIIRNFAHELEIHPGILLGRLQKEGIVGWNRFNNLKITYKWSFE